MKKYIIEYGYVYDNGVINYDLEEEFESYDEAKKEFDSYVSLDISTYSFMFLSLQNDDNVEKIDEYWFDKDAMEAYYND